MGYSYPHGSCYNRAMALWSNTMTTRWKYLALIVTALPALWYIAASAFFSMDVYTWWIIRSIALPSDVTQVASEERKDAVCQTMDTGKLYITNKSWEEVNQTFLDYFKIHYDSAIISVYPDTQRDRISVVQIMNRNIITLQRRNVVISVKRIDDVGQNYGEYTWISGDVSLHDTVAKANTVYEIRIRYIANVEAYRENCT